MSGRFKDYIAVPKFNLYQSLHTTVVGPGGKPVEIQIRTHEMHRMAEYGVAAHWRYKEDPNASGPSALGGRPGDSDQGDMGWLRQLVDWQKETQDPTEFLDALRYEMAGDQVYVFTPRGDVLALPAGGHPGGLRLRRPHRGRPPHRGRTRQQPTGAPGHAPGER